jgi:hypothetical protein
MSQRRKEHPWSVRRRELTLGMTDQVSIIATGVPLEVYASIDVYI